MIISLDTEATGVDLYHGAAPYLVTICDEEWNNTYWEWDVDPHTRKVKVVESDLEEIVDFIVKADKLVLQNPKFDVTALMPLIKELLPVWPWEKTEDTLIAAHLTASNKPKDLNTLALEWLGIDITPLEDAVEEAVKEAKSLVKDLGWRLAQVGLPEMPSVKEKTWKFDMWLPRAVAKRKIAGWKKEWLTVTADYANGDSGTTLGVWQRQMKAIKDRGLEAIYQTRLKLLPIIYEMEMYGVTYSETRRKELYEQYLEESAKAERICLNIAEGYNYCLELPKSGTNNSLKTFIFDVMKLEPIYANKKKKTKSPDLDKRALEQYQATLPPKSKQALFINNLINKRKRDTAINYMVGYDKFSQPTNDKDFKVLHPSLNVTGTDTLRFSSSHPNEQNISKQEGFNLRYCFGPASGREWWSMDAANIELRIPAYVAGEQEMINLFERPNDPPYYGSQHGLNFHTVYPDLWDQGVAEVGLDKVGRHLKEKYKSTWYQYCKNGGFAVQYGSVEASGTADRAFHRAGSFAKLKQKFQKVHGPGGLNDRMIKMAEQLGYILTLPDNSIGPNKGYPLLCTRSQWGRILPTVPLNYFTQGSACWWMIKAMIRCYVYLKQLTEETGLPHFMTMQVHDELVFDLPHKPNKGNLPIVKELARLMEMGSEDIGVPVPVKAEYHPENWADGEFVPFN